jgi:hypothetical protein
MQQIAITVKPTADNIDRIDLSQEEHTPRMAGANQRSS